MNPTLEDVLLAVDDILAPAMLANRFNRIEVAAGSDWRVATSLGEDPVSFLHDHQGRFPKSRWWQRWRSRGRVEVLWIGFEHQDLGDEEMWMTYDAVSGALDTSDWFTHASTGAEDSRDRVDSNEALCLRLRLAAREVTTAD